MRLVSKLINEISRVLKKILKYLNGTIIWTAYVLLFSVELVIFYLNLKEALLP